MRAESIGQYPSHPGLTGPGSRFSKEWHRESRKGKAEAASERTAGAMQREPKNTPPEGPTHGLLCRFSPKGRDAAAFSSMLCRPGGARRDAGR